MRHLRIEVVRPPVEDDRVELATWSSGSAPLAAARRMSLAGDRGGRVELDSVWVHLGPDARPARIGDFGPYAEAAAGRVVSTRLELLSLRRTRARARWPLRATDEDLLGHVNNAAYWHAVEERLRRRRPDPRAAAPRAARPPPRDRRGRRGRARRGSERTASSGWRSSWQGWRRRSSAVEALS